MNRRSFLMATGLGFQAKGQKSAPTTPKCPHCGKDKYQAYILPLMKLVKGPVDGSGRMTVEPDDSRVVEMLECSNCHTMFGAGAKG